MPRLTQVAFAALLAFASVFLFWSCHTGPEYESQVVDLEADSAWMEFDRLLILHVNDSGRVLDTLYMDSLQSPEKLRRMTLEGAPNGSRVVLKGFLQGSLVFEQKRDYDSGAPELIVESRVWLLSVRARPDSLTLVLDGEGAEVHADVRPLMAERAVAWALGPGGVAEFETAPGPLAPSVRIRPVKIGETFLTLRHPLDSTRIDTVRVRVVPREPQEIRIAPDTLRLLLEGPAGTLRANVLPAGADSGILWSTQDARIAAVDAEGVVRPLAAGTTRIIAKAALSAAADTALVIVAPKDPPPAGNRPPRILALRADTTVSIGDTLAMTATVSDTDGQRLWAAWDFDGDGGYEDSTDGIGPRLSVSIRNRYEQAGVYRAVLRARDDSGATALDTVEIRVALDAPVADLGPDTTVLAGSPWRVSVKGQDAFGSIVSRELKVGDGPFVHLSRQDTTLVAPALAGRLVLIGRVTDDDGLSDVDTLVVTFEKRAPIRETVAGRGGRVELDTARAGSLTIHVIPDTGFRVDSVLVNETPLPLGPPVYGEPFVHTLPSADAVVRVRAAFRRYFLIPMTVTGKGRVEPPGGAVDSAGGRTFVMTPDAGHDLVKVAGEAGSLLDQVKGDRRVGPCTLTVARVAAPMALEVEFAPDPKPVFSLVRTAGPGGRIEGLDGSIDSGSAVTVTIRPDSAYRVDSLFVNGTRIVVPTDPTAVGKPFTHSIPSMDKDYTIRATFRRSYRVRVTGAAGGSVSHPAAQVDSGSVAVFTSYPDTLHRVGAVVLNGATLNAGATLRGQSFTHTVPSVSTDLDFRPVFVRLFRVAVLTGPGGSVTPSRPDVDSGTTQRFVITPAAGYRVDSVFVDATLLSVKAVGRGATQVPGIGVGGDRTLRVTFLRWYAVTVSVTGTGGTLTADSLAVDSAGTRAFNINPAAGYALASLTDGATDHYTRFEGEVDGVSTLRLTGISAPVNLAARFAPKVAIRVQTDSTSRTGGSHTPPPYYHWSINGRAMNMNNFADETPLMVPVGARLNLEADPVMIQCARCLEVPFKFWDRDGITVATTPAYSFTVEAAATLTGVYISWP